MVALLLYLSREHEEENFAENSPENRVETSSPVPPSSAVIPSRIAQSAPVMDQELEKIPSHPLAVSFGSDREKATDEADQVYQLFNFYRESFGSFPSGEGNAQFMNALRGANPERLPIFPAEHPRLNSDGELLDAWNTAFFFHQIAADQIEIRSAGPDKEFYTVDDITAPKW